MKNEQSYAGFSWICGEKPWFWGVGRSQPGWRVPRHKRSAALGSGEWGVGNCKARNHLSRLISFFYHRKPKRALCGLADGADMPLTLAIASQKPLKNLFPDSPYRTSPLAGICPQIDVGPFSSDEARKFLQHRLEGTGVSFSESQINELLAQSNCYPDRLQRAAADLYRRLVMP